MVESENLKMLINDNSLLLLRNNWDEIGMGWVGKHTLGIGIGIGKNGTGHFPIPIPFSRALKN